MEGGVDGDGGVVQRNGEQMALPRDVGYHWGRSCTSSTAIPCQSLHEAIAAFNYDYNALDGGERSAISKGYEDIL